MRYLLLTILIVNISTISSYGQIIKPDTNDRYNQLESRYQKFKDSLAASYRFSPAVSSIVLNHKQIEVDFFNVLLSAKKTRNGNGNLRFLPVRSTYLFSSVQFTYGISKNDRWNIGFDVNAKAARLDKDLSSSIFKIFSPETEGRSETANAVTSFGPRIRWKPFRSNYHFTLQSSFSIPFVINAEKEGIIGSKQAILGTQLIYNVPLGKRLFLFPQLALHYGFKNDHVNPLFYTSISSYIGYLIPRKIILFSLINYIPIFRKPERWVYEQYTFQFGAGLQYHISRNFFINAYYSKDIAGKNFNYFDNYSLGVSFISD